MAIKDFRIIWRLPEYDPGGFGTEDSDGCAYAIKAFGNPRSTPIMEQEERIIAAVQ